MTVINAGSRPRSFPSKFVLVAAGELTFIAFMLRWSNSPVLFAGSVAASLVSIQLGAVLLRRFQRDTRDVRKAAAAAEVSSQAVFITDPTGRIKWTNAKFATLTGFNLADSAGKTFAMLLHGQLTDARTVEFLRHEMRRERSFTVEILQYNKTNEQIWVQSQGEPCYDTAGRVTHYVITQTDVSDQRRQTLEIEQLASVIARVTEGESKSIKPIQLEAEYPANDPALRLAQQLEQLSSADDRVQLQQMVDSLKSRMEDCVTIMPLQNIKSSAA